MQEILRMIVLKMILSKVFETEADLYEKEFIWTGAGSIFYI